MIQDILAAIWFFLPAGFANSAPVFRKYFPIIKEWNYPVDFKKNFKDKRILGDNKTVGGFFFGFLIALITVVLQVVLFDKFEAIKDISYLDYMNVNVFSLAAVLSMGALGGDAIKSFFKRQLGIKPGKSWVPFDQIDYIIGGLIGSIIFIQLEATDYLTVALVWFVIHLLSNWVGYKLKIREQPI